VYAGDTPLHAAAAAYRYALVPTLTEMGADVRARNRRGAYPLHYAADGIPGSVHWDPAAQRATVIALLMAGADPNAADKGGVTPLHRAVRNRCASAVGALLQGGADARLANASGSTPLQLARWTTGRGGTGSAVARAEQAAIVRLLIEHGAQP
jgi:ankyrin repeat protein